MTIHLFSRSSPSLPLLQLLLPPLRAIDQPLLLPMLPPLLRHQPLPQRMPQPLLQPHHMHLLLLPGQLMVQRFTLMFPQGTTLSTLSVTPTPTTLATTRTGMATRPLDLTVLSSLTLAPRLWPTLLMRMAMLLTSSTREMLSTQLRSRLPMLQHLHLPILLPLLQPQLLLTGLLLPLPQPLLTGRPLPLPQLQLIGQLLLLMLVPTKRSQSLII